MDIPNYPQDPDLHQMLENALGGSVCSRGGGGEVTAKTDPPRINTSNHCWVTPKP